MVDASYMERKLIKIPIPKSRYTAKDFSAALKREKQGLNGSQNLTNDKFYGLMFSIMEKRPGNNHYWYHFYPLTRGVVAVVLKS